MIQLDKQIKEASISAVVIRADGRREDLGVVARLTRPWWQRAWVRLRGTLALAVTIALFAYAFLYNHPGAILGAGPFFMDAGKAIVTNLISGLGGTVPKYHAVGTGAGPANSAAAALTTEVEARVAGAVSRLTTTVNNDTFQSVGTQTMTNTRAITEVGLFDQLALGGNCLVMSSISVINLGVGDSLLTIFRLSFS
jgi:hypothetical protein